MNRTILRRSAALSTLAAVAGPGRLRIHERAPEGHGTGAGVGAVAGAVIGAATGGSAGTGAVIGGVVGAIAGNLWSKHMEDKREAMETATAGTGIDVVRTTDNQIMVNVPSDFSFDIGQCRHQARHAPGARPVRRRTWTPRCA